MWLGVNSSLVGFFYLINWIYEAQFTYHITYNITTIFTGYYSVRDQIQLYNIFIYIFFFFIDKHF